MHHSPEALIQLFVALFHDRKHHSIVQPRKVINPGRAAFIPSFGNPRIRADVALEGAKESLAWMTATSMIVATTAFVSPVLASDADLATGAALFKANCSGCHLGGANFIAEKKTLQKEALEKFQSLDQEKLQVFVETKMPHRMLPFHNEFTVANYRDVTSFVLDQALGDKW